MAPGPVWFGRDARGHVPPAGRAGAPCDDLPASRRRPDRMGQGLGRPVQDYVRKRKRTRRVKAVKPVAPDQGPGRGRGALA